MIRKLEMENQEEELKYLRQLLEKNKALQKEKEHVIKLAHELSSFWFPSPAYPLFLHEQYILFQLWAMKDNKICKFDTFKNFLNTFIQCDLANQHLICELYMHESIMYHKNQFSPSPYGGDIQLRSFTSFVNNMVQWKLT